MRHSTEDIEDSRIKKVLEKIRPEKPEYGELIRNLSESNKEIADSLSDSFKDLPKYTSTLKDVPKDIARNFSGTISNNLSEVLGSNMNQLHLD
jgi:uncharacterized protein (DUF885 family)